MITKIRRLFSIYSAIAATTIKARLAYNLWVWADFFITLGSMVIFVYFWRAVYANTPVLGGLTLSDTITYILLARFLSPLIDTRMIFSFGFMIRNGQVAVELIRPLDMQFRYLVETLSEVGVFIVQRIPIFLFAWLVLGMRLPKDPGLWIVFGVTLLLGQIVIFLFDWTFACISFYTTETWGLSVVRVGVGAFFSGSLVPLLLMPVWLQTTAAAMPFAQAMAVPISFLSGISTLTDAPKLVLIQLVWILGLLIISRLVFNVAIKRITVQGG
ncbi:MAG: hypothetical protein C0410_09010 [Anaerolinea sp.]|nr:hypothetical protein [Anaerolinea sp.]